MSDLYDFPRLAEISLRAFLATTFFDADGGRKQRMSDQARRLGILIVQMTFGRGRPGLWVKKQSDLARALSINKGDCSKAEAMLVECKILRVQERGDCRWYELMPSVMALQLRSLGAQAAVTEIDKWHVERETNELLARRAEELEDAGVGDALAEVDRENVVGKVPTASWESPNYELGKSQPHWIIRYPRARPSNRTNRRRRANRTNRGGSVAVALSADRQRDDSTMMKRIMSLNCWNRLTAQAS